MPTPRCKPWQPESNPIASGKPGAVQIHFRRQPGHDLTLSQRKANRVRSKVRSAVETVFAGQKDRFGLFVRTIGLARARTKVGLANLAYNLQRFLWIEARPVVA